MLGNNDAAGAERRRRAQDRADIVRIGDLIEHEDGRAALSHLNGAQNILEIGVFERLDFESPALVHGALRQQPLESGTVQCLHRLAAAVPLGQGIGDQRGRLALLPGKHDKPSPAPRRIGKRRADRVSAVQPVVAAPGTCAPDGSTILVAHGVAGVCVPSERATARLVLR